MKKSIAIVPLTLAFLFFDLEKAISQSQTLRVTIQVKSELTGLPLDVEFTGMDANKTKKIAKGEYVALLDPGEREEVTLSKDGYFDETLKLDYESEKAFQFREVKLKPGIPQLLITILDAETSQTLSSTVDLFTIDESSIVFSDTVKTSPYTIDLEYDKVHVLQVRRPGYFSYKDTINLAHVFDGSERRREIRLMPLKTGNKISLNNIYFQPNEANLTEFAKIMLVELTHILQLEKNLVIEVGAHTDGVGSVEYNQGLSEKRAMSVKKYLLDKGASDRQLIAKGYGKSFPIQPNDTEANRSLNRRVEFKIISVK